jgi:hypothetical protein
LKRFLSFYHRFSLVFISLLVHSPWFFIVIISYHTLSVLSIAKSAENSPFPKTLVTFKNFENIHFSHITLKILYILSNFMLFIKNSTWKYIRFYPHLKYLVRNLFFFFYFNPFKIPIFIVTAFAERKKLGFHQAFS